MTQYDGEIIINLELQQEEFEKRLSELEGKTSNFGNKIKGALATLGLAKIGKDFISAGVDYNTAMENYIAGLTTLLGSADKAEKMIADLKEYASATPFEMSDLSSATQTLLSFGVAQQDVMGIMKMLGDVSLGDQQKFQSLALVFGQVSSQGKLMGQDLLQMINAGFNPLQIISEKTGESMSSLKEKMSKGKIGIDEVTQAFQWATSEGGKFYGGMERGSKTLSGQISTLKDNFNEFTGKAVKPLTDFASKTLLPKLIELFKYSDDILDIMGKMVPVILAIGTGFLAWKVVNFIQGLPAMFAALKAAILGVNGALMANPIAAVIAAVAALAAGFIYLWNTSEEFRNFWIGLWNDVSAVFMDIWNTILEFFTVTIPEAWNQFVESLVELKDTIIQIFAEAWNSIISFFTETIPTWIDSVIEWFAKIPYNLGYLLGQAIGHIVQFGINLVNFATNDIPNFINSVVSWFAQLPGKIWTWLVSAFDNVKTWGSNIYSAAKEWVSKTINNIISYFASLPGKIWNWLVNSANKVVTWGSDLYTKGKEAAGELVNSVVDGIKGLPSQMVSIGKDLVEGLWNGINDMVGWIGEKIESFGSGVLDGIKDFFGIHSPSTVMRDMIGKYLPPGIAVGFEMAMPESIKNMGNDIDRMSSNLQKRIDMNMNDLSASAYLEGNIKVTRNSDITNSFPKSMKMEGGQDVYLITEDGTELAHWFAPYIDKELKFE